MISHDSERLLGWVTRKAVLGALAKQLGSAEEDAERGAVAAEFAIDHPEANVRVPSAPLAGYRLVEVTVGPGSPALGRRVAEIDWPPGYLVVAVTEGREVVAPRVELELGVGERVVLLVQERNVLARN